MQLTNMAAAAGTPGPLPIITTKGPKDWVGLPLATFTWNERIPPTPGFANPEGFSKLDGVTSLNDAIAAAVRASYNSHVADPLATGVLQAADGAYYLARIGSRGTAPGNGFYFPKNESLVVTSLTQHVDALKAVVGGTTIVRFAGTGGDTPKPTPVGPTKPTSKA